MSNNFDGRNRWARVTLKVLAGKNPASHFNFNRRNDMLVKKKVIRSYEFDGICDFMAEFPCTEKDFKEATGYDWKKFDNEISDQECIEQILDKRKEKYTVEFIETRRDGYFVIEEI